MFEIKLESAFRLNFSIYEKYRENVDIYVHLRIATFLIILIKRTSKAHFAQKGA